MSFRSKAAWHIFFPLSPVCEDYLTIVIYTFGSVYILIYAHGMTLVLNL